MARLEAISTPDPTTEAELIVVSTMKEAVEQRGRFLMVLSGGRTPDALYRRLAEMPDLPWHGVHLFWGDERFVPPDHQDSNARAARAAFIDLLSIPVQQVHTWPILDTPKQSAEAYAATIEREAGSPPLFDLNLLGLGSDCHTASLFPGTGTHNASGLTVHSRPSQATGDRLSLTAGALGRSRTTLFLVTGAGKRQALSALLAGGDPADCPARAIGALERLLLLTDQPLPATNA